MPKSKKSKNPFVNEFPNLTRLLAEIARFRENERIQPRLPFSPGPGSQPDGQPAISPDAPIMAVRTRASRTPRK